MDNARDIKIVHYEHDKPGYGPRLTSAEWERFRPILTDYANQGLTRQQIVDTARAEHGFRGTYSTLNRRFKDWKLTATRSVQEHQLDDESGFEIERLQPTDGAPEPTDNSCNSSPEVVPCLESQGSQVMDSDEQTGAKVLSSRDATVDQVVSSLDRLFPRGITLDQTERSHDLFSSPDTTVDEVKQSPDLYPGRHLAIDQIEPCVDFASYSKSRLDQMERMLELLACLKTAPSVPSLAHKTSTATLSDPSALRSDALAPLESFNGQTRAGSDSISSGHSSKSSDTKQFRQLAKRLRKHPPQLTSSSSFSTYFPEENGDSENRSTFEPERRAMIDIDEVDTLAEEQGDTVVSKLDEFACADPFFDGNTHPATHGMSDR